MSRLHIIISVLLLHLPVVSASQTIECSGVRFPKSSKIHTVADLNSLGKALYDTLHYVTLEKTRDDFIVNTGSDSAGSDQWHINIASDPRGWFLCAWNDERAGDQMVDAQLFDNAGNRVGSVIHVSEPAADWNSAPDIVFNRASSEYIVVWAGNGYNIRFQRISASGQKVGANLTANLQYRTNTNNPSVAVDSTGNFVMTWYADVAGNLSEEVICRAFDRQGAPITDEWFPADSSTARTTSVGWETRIASDSSGRCIVVWSCQMNGHSRIVLQSVSRTGNLYSQPVLVTRADDAGDYYFPTVASTKDGHFLITWDSSDFAFNGRVFHPDSGFVTPQFNVMNQQQHYWATWDVSSDDRNRFLVAWSTDRLYARAMSSHGEFTGAAIPLPLPVEATMVPYPKLSKASADRVFLVYNAYVRSQQDVMLQPLDLSLNPVGGPVKAADDGRTGAWQVNPVVKFNQEGKSLVVWEDRRNGYHQLFGQVLDQSGNPVAANFQISADTNHYTSNYSIACENNGNFLVTFRGGGYSDGNLVAQKVSPSGTLIGPNVWVERNLYFYNGEPENGIQVNDKGETLFWWQDHSSLATDRLTSNLASQGLRSFIFNSYVSSGKQILGAHVNRRFNFLVLWRDYDYATYTAGNVLKAILLDEHGLKLGDTMTVATLPASRDFSLASCRLDDENNMLFVWYDYNRDGTDLVMHIKREYRTTTPSSYTDAFSIDWRNTRLQIVRFESRQTVVAWDSYGVVNAVYLSDDLAPFDPRKTPMRLHTFTVSPEAPGESHKIFNVDIFRNNLLLAYQSPHVRDRGFDVYANIQHLDALSFPGLYPTTEVIAPAYPNPSTHAVQLQYEVTQPTEVAVSVYNILGQKIADIENGTKAPGTYTVQFPTSGLASGVYYFYYRGLNTCARKFLVVR